MSKYTVEDISDAIHMAWQQGKLSYLRRNTQRKIHASWLSSKINFRKFYIECTRRLGKSTELLLTLTEEAKARPHTKYGFFAPVKDGLLDYVEPLISKTFEDCPMEERPQFDQAHFRLTFKNGSRIVFRGSNNKQHRIRRGQEFHAAAIDEARDVDDLVELIDSVIMPALFSADGYLLISSTPADTRSHPLYDIRTRAIAEGWYIKMDIWDANRLDPDVYSIDRINEWKEETSKGLDGADIWAREYECKWVVNSRRVCVPEWNSQTMVQPFSADPYYQFYHHYMGLDWGYKDYTAVTIATLNFRKSRLEVDAELTFSGKDVRSDIVSDRISAMTDHLWGQKSPVWRGMEPNIYRQVSDSADPILINELNRYKGMNFTPVQKAHTLDAMINEFRILVAQGKIVVRPNCQLTIHCLENAVWDDKRTKLDQDVLAHHFDHLMSLIYLTRMINWQANPIPADFMIDNVRILDLNFDKHPKSASNKSARTLEAAFGGRH